MIQDLMLFCGMVGLLLLAWLVVERRIAATRMKVVAQPNGTPKAEPAAPAPNCACEVCTEARKLAQLLLTPIEVGQLQVGVVNVRRGAAPVAICEAEFVLPDGAGSTVLVVTNDAVYQRIVRPALAQHFSAPREM